MWTRRRAITTIAASAALIIGGGLLRLTTDGATEIAGHIAAALGGIGAIVGAIGMAFVRSRAGEQ